MHFHTNVYTHVYARVSTHVHTLCSLKDCTLELTVLGLRNLIPAKMARLNSPYLEINCGDKEQSRTTPPSREPTPHNPNYGKLIVIHLQLPIDPLFAPCLCIYVYDRFLGFRRSVGTGVIPLSSFLPWLDGEDALLRHQFSVGDGDAEPEVTPVLISGSTSASLRAMSVAHP